MNAVLAMDVPAAGATSIVSQSGTMLGTVLSRGAARGLGFAKLVSVGNESDVGVGEIVQLLAADAETRTILLFLETVRDAAALERGARAAHAAGKPVVAYKLGRSKLGERLARSHTGALAGEDAALDAYFRDCGIVRVDMLETLIEIGPLLAGRKPLDLARAPRVAVVTTTGGGAASVVDRLGTLGIETASPDAQSPIIDLTMGKRPPTYGAVVRRTARVPGLRRGTRGGRLIRAIRPAARGRTHHPCKERREAAGGVHDAAGRPIARAARAGGHRGLPHARSLCRCSSRFFFMEISQADFRRHGY